MLKNIIFVWPPVNPCNFQNVECKVVLYVRFFVFIMYELSFLFKWSLYKALNQVYIIIGKVCYMYDIKFEVNILYIWIFNFQFLVLKHIKQELSCGLSLGLGGIPSTS